MIEDDAYWITFQYSEWLDGEGLVVADEISGDDRSHDELVRAFLAQRSDLAMPVVTA